MEGNERKMTTKEEEERQDTPRLCFRDVYIERDETSKSSSSFSSLKFSFLGSTLSLSVSSLSHQPLCLIEKLHHTRSNRKHKQIQRDKQINRDWRSIDGYTPGLLYILCVGQKMSPQWRKMQANCRGESVQWKVETILTRIRRSFYGKFLLVFVFCCTAKSSVCTPRPSRSLFLLSAYPRCCCSCSLKSERGGSFISPYYQHEVSGVPKEGKKKERKERKRNTEKKKRAEHLYTVTRLMHARACTWENLYKTTTFLSGFFTQTRQLSFLSFFTLRLLHKETKKKKRKESTLCTVIGNNMMKKMIPNVSSKIEERRNEKKEFLFLSSSLSLSIFTTTTLLSLSLFSFLCSPSSTPCQQEKEQKQQQQQELHQHSLSLSSLHPQLHHRSSSSSASISLASFVTTPQTYIYTCMQISKYFSRRSFLEVSLRFIRLVCRSQHQKPAALWRPLSSLRPPSFVLSTSLLRFFYNLTRLKSLDFIQLKNNDETADSLPSHPQESNERTLLSLLHFLRSRLVSLLLLFSRASSPKCTQERQQSLPLYLS